MLCNHPLQGKTLKSWYVMQGKTWKTFFNHLRCIGTQRTINVCFLSNWKELCDCIHNFFFWLRTKWNYFWIIFKVNCQYDQIPFNLNIFFWLWTKQNSVRFWNSVWLIIEMKWNFHFNYWNEIIWMKINVINLNWLNWLQPI